MFVFLTLLSLPVKAVDTVSSESIGLTLSPLRTELTIEPGTRVQKTLLVSNRTDKKMTVSFSAESFKTTNESYDYVFDRETEIATWVQFEHENIELDPSQTSEETYSIGVPLGTEPGGRYLTLFVSYDTVTDASDKTLSRQRVGSNQYITVSGDVTRQGSIEALTSPSFVGGGDPRWSVLIENSGTTHFRSRYSVSVENLIGGGSVATLTGNALVLPHTTRSINDKLPLPKLPGIYKVVYTIGLGDTPAVTETRFVIYVPTVIIIVVIMAFVLIMSLLTQKVRKRRASRSEVRQYTQPK